MDPKCEEFRPSVTSATSQKSEENKSKKTDEKKEHLSVDIPPKEGANSIGKIKEDIPVEPLSPGVIMAPTLTDPTQSLWKPQYKGKIKSFNDSKGFGFIDSEKARTTFGRDVFIHKNQIDNLGTQSPQGMEVQFEIELNKNGQPQARNVVALSRGGNDNGRIDPQLQECSTSYQIYEVVSLHGANLTYHEVITALYQLSITRKFETWAVGVPPHFARALIERLMAENVEKLSEQDISKIIFAIMSLEEVQITSVRKYVFEDLAAEIKRNVKKFHPTEMANLIGSISALRRTQREDEVVADITMNYSAIVSAASNPFPAHETDVWRRFLASIVQKNYYYY